MSLPDDLSGGGASRGESPPLLYNINFNAAKVINGEAAAAVELLLVVN